MGNIIDSKFEQQVNQKVTEATEFVKKASNNVPVLICATSIGLLVTRYMWIKLKRMRNKSPPGPIGVPLFGSVLSLLLNEKGFFENIRSYGDISTFSLFTTPAIAIHDPVIAGQVFRNNLCLSRILIDKEFWKVHEGRSVNILAFPYGPKWIKHRKIIQTKFMMLLNSKMLEKSINTVCKDIVFKDMDECIRKKKPFFPLEYVMFVSFNSIFKVLFGRGIGNMDSKEYLDWLENTPKRMEHSNIYLWGTMIGITSRSVGSYFAKILYPDVKAVYDILSKCILETTGYKINPLHGTYEDKGKKYIKYDEDTPSAAKLFIKEFNICGTDKMNEQNALEYFSTIDELLFAGVDTTGKSAEFTITLLAKHTDVQQKVYQELKDAFEENNLEFFSFDIVTKLHLFRAFIWESLRVSSLTKIGFPRFTTGDIKVGKYVIPKNTVVMLDMKGCNIHNKIWKNNGKFCLDNWLDSDGKFKFNNNFLGLSIGRRDCPGKGVVRRTFYCFFANLIMHYKLEFANKTDKIGEEWGLTNQLMPKVGLKLEKRISIN